MICCSIPYEENMEIQHPSDRMLAAILKALITAVLTESITLVVTQGSRGFWENILFQG